MMPAEQSPGDMMISRHIQDITRFLTEYRQNLPNMRKLAKMIQAFHIFNLSIQREVPDDAIDSYTEAYEKCRNDLTGPTMHLLYQEDRPTYITEGFRILKKAFEAQQTFITESGKMFASPRKKKPVTEGGGYEQVA